MSSSPRDHNEDHVSSAPASTATAATASFFEDEGNRLDSRAGEDGYSVLRRPVTFDADVDPTFAAPGVLDEEEAERARNDANRIWYAERQDGREDVLDKYNVQEESDSARRRRPTEEHPPLDMHDRTLRTLDYHVVLRALADECESAFGKNLVLRAIASREEEAAAGDDGDALTMPLSAASMEGAHRRYGAVQEMQRLMEGRVDGFVTSTRKNQYSNNKKVEKLPLGAPPTAGHSLDLQTIFGMLDEGKVLAGPEILDVTSLLELSLDVLDWSDALQEANDAQRDENTGSATPFVELPRLTASIYVDDDFYHLLSTAFDSEGRLSGTAFPAIGRLRAKVRAHKRDILSTVDALLALPSVQSKLAVESGGALTMEINGRLVVPIQQQHQSSVGIVHDASRSGKTVYVEPREVVGPTNELRRAEAELRREEERTWRQLTEATAAHRKELARNAAALGQLDVAQARVRLGTRLGGSVPTVGNEGVVSVKEARHPVLLLRGLENVVGSDVDLGVCGYVCVIVYVCACEILNKVHLLTLPIKGGDNQGLILTGPNSGGKTIILVSDLCCAMFCLFVWQWQGCPTMFPQLRMCQPKIALDAKGLHKDLDSVENYYIQ